jgi:hypothetical protein
MDAKIQVHDKTVWHCKQSKLAHMPSLPMRGVMVAPSGAFKTVAIVDLILRFYRGCFERVYIFSPSANIDSAWRPVKEYIRVHLGVRDNEKCFFEEFDSDALEKIVADQRKLTEALKEKKGNTKLYSVLAVFDDLADDPRIMHNQSKNVLSTLFVRGRHFSFSSICSIQKNTTLAPVIRVNAQFICIGRMRNQKELLSVLEEITAIYPMATLMKLYEIATSKPHGFLYVNLSTSPPEFYSAFTHRLHVRPASRSSLPSSAQSGQKTIAGPPPDASQSPPP